MNSGRDAKREVLVQDEDRMFRESLCEVLSSSMAFMSFVPVPCVEEVHDLVDLNKVHGIIFESTADSADMREFVDRISSDYADAILVCTLAKEHQNVLRMDGVHYILRNSPSHTFERGLSGRNARKFLMNFFVRVLRPPIPTI